MESCFELCPAAERIGAFIRLSLVQTRSGGKAKSRMGWHSSLRFAIGGAHHGVVDVQPQ
jgi:hypothetical protein